METPETLRLDVTPWNTGPVGGASSARDWLEKFLPYVHSTRASHWLGGYYPFGTELAHDGNDRLLACFF
ncbi:hypothetical protein SCLCIDRAFT_1208112 [Scleroderma citrinum Foug A]|uniref:Uncharacterized protein n=1 Tax=Scleroderma citrinum Foug A TaxID=1036808 RepID=A0A0C3AXE3_9AGAM|nr:hypothetical protein SCLCIDRAFT_1208112 [Scleroderma citrinum Foug A]